MHHLDPLLRGFLGLELGARTTILRNEANKSFVFSMSIHRTASGAVKRRGLAEACELLIGFRVIGSNELTRRLASIHTETQEELTGGVRVTIDRDCLRI